MIAVLASGNGSNFEAIVRAGITELILVCDNQDAFVIQRAKHLGIRTIVLNYHGFSSRQAYNQSLLKILSEWNITLIVLAGYMRIIDKSVLTKYPKILNIHPSLLPSFKGNKAIAEAFAFGVKVTGVTIHFIDEYIDEGKIVFQKAITIEPNDTLSSLEAKIHRVEHEYYPKIIKEVMEELEHESISECK